MAKTPDVVPDQKIASTWGNEIRDRTRQVFANGTDVTNNWPTAPDGAEIFVTDVQTTWRKLRGTWRECSSLTWSYNGNLTTDQFGNGVLNFPGGATRANGVTAVGTQRQFPKFVVWDITDANPVRAVLWFFDKDGNPAISTTVGVSVLANLIF